MGLIDRAIEEDDVEGTLALAARRPLRAGAPFTIDFDTLSAKGYFTPGGSHNERAVELRSIKRRLLRRLGLLQRAGGETGAVKRGRARNVVLVTSTAPSEGKTFTATNLALSFALEDQRPVILIDGDAPRPKLGALFGLEDAPGLSDRLTDQRLPVEAFTYTATNGPLSVIPTGVRTENATGLFASARAQSFFAELSAQSAERLVVIDAPPLMATTETIALARHADEVVFVVEANRTPETAAAAALDELLELNPNVSLVLNRCLISQAGANYDAYGSYYDRSGAHETAMTAGGATRG